MAVAVSSVRPATPGPWFGRVLIGALAWGALAFGAVYPWAYLPLSAACAALGVRAALVPGADGSRWRPDWLTLALAAAAVGIALQIVPLPYDLFARLSPGADAYLRVQILGFEAPASRALSLSPDDTANALWLFSGLTILFVGLVHALSGLRLEWLASRILVLGVLLAVIAAVQAAAIDRQEPLVYGFWRPRQFTVPFGPFINRNHFAGWMVMAIPVAVGYSLLVFEASDRPRLGGWRAWLVWLTRPEASRFALVVFSILAMATSIVLSGSRSGIASLVLGLLVFGAVVLARGRRHPRGVVAVYLLALAAGAVAWAGVGGMIQRFALATTDLPGRVLGWQDTLRIIRDFPLTGVGIGAFPHAMLQYQSFDRRYLYNQAHNDYLEVLAEGGLLVAVPTAIAAGLFLWRVVHRLLAPDEDPARMWVRAGAAAGLAGIAAQSLVEFSLQMPGNAALFVLLAAIASHAARLPRPRSPR